MLASGLPLPASPPPAPTTHSTHQPTRVAPLPSTDTPVVSAHRHPAPTDSIPAQTVPSDEAPDTTTPPESQTPHRFAPTTAAQSHTHAQDHPAAQPAPKTPSGPAKHPRESASSPTYYPDNQGSQVESGESESGPGAIALLACRNRECPGYRAETPHDVHLGEDANKERPIHALRSGRPLQQRASRQGSWMAAPGIPRSSGIQRLT